MYHRPRKSLVWDEFFTYKNYSYFAINDIILLVVGIHCIFIHSRFISLSLFPVFISVLRSRLCDVCCYCLIVSEIDSELVQCFCRCFRSVQHGFKHDVYYVNEHYLQISGICFGLFNICFINR